MTHDFFKNKNPQVNPQECRGLFEKNPENFPKSMEMAKNRLLGVVKSAEHEFGNEKILRC